MSSMLTLRFSSAFASAKTLLLLAFADDDIIPKLLFDVIIGTEEDVAVWCLAGSLLFRLQFGLTGNASSSSPFTSLDRLSLSGPTGPRFLSLSPLVTLTVNSGPWGTRNNNNYINHDSNIYIFQIYQDSLYMHIHVYVMFPTDSSDTEPPLGVELLSELSAARAWPTLDSSISP